MDDTAWESGYRIERERNQKTLQLAIEDWRDLVVLDDRPPRLGGGVHANDNLQKLWLLIHEYFRSELENFAALILFRGRRGIKAVAAFRHHVKELLTGLRTGAWEATLTSFGRDPDIAFRLWPPSCWPAVMPRLKEQDIAPFERFLKDVDIENVDAEWPGWYPLRLEGVGNWPGRLGGKSPTPWFSLAGETGPLEMTAESQVSPGPTRARIERFLKRVSDSCGRKIHHVDIVRVAGYKDSRGFERFASDHSRTTTPARKKFERILAMTPQEFIAALGKVKPF